MGDQGSFLGKFGAQSAGPSSATLLGPLAPPSSTANPSLYKDLPRSRGRSLAEAARLEVTPPTELTATSPGFRPSSSRRPPPLSPPHHASAPPNQPFSRTSLGALDITAMGPPSLPSRTSAAPFISSFDPWTPSPYPVPSLLPPPRPNSYSLPTATTISSRATFQLSYRSSEIAAIWTRTAEEERRQQDGSTRHSNEYESDLWVNGVLGMMSLGGPPDGRTIGPAPTSAPIREAQESFNLSRNPAQGGRQTLPVSSAHPYDSSLQHVPPTITTSSSARSCSQSFITPLGTPWFGATHSSLPPQPHPPSFHSGYSQPSPFTSNSNTPPYIQNSAGPFHTPTSHGPVSPPVRNDPRSLGFHPQPKSPLAIHTSSTAQTHNGTKTASRATLRSGLPASPARSPHSIWVGNVPADATTEELWRFFSGSEEIVSGVESVHLISR